MSETSTTVPGFDVVITAGPSATELRLRGELDIATVSLLVPHLDEACSDSRALLIDLSELRYCDSSGIRELLKAAARCAQVENEFKIVGAHGSVLRVFEVAGVASTLGLTDR